MTLMHCIAHSQLQCIKLNYAFILCLPWLCSMRNICRFTDPTNDKKKKTSQYDERYIDVRCVMEEKDKEGHDIFFDNMANEDHVDPPSPHSVIVVEDTRSACLDLEMELIMENEAHSPFGKDKESRTKRKLCAEFAKGSTTSKTQRLFPLLLLRFATSLGAKLKADVKDALGSTFNYVVEIYERVIRYVEVDTEQKLSHETYNIDRLEAPPLNADECLMTRMQQMSLDYHFKVEQEVGSSTYAFFGFNGTAGVWRISALNEAGGWKDRTTVEDMDLAVRASLKGWKFLYLSSVQVKNELPSTLKAYRYQQHRWSCGPANLFRKVAMEIFTNKKVSLWKKFHVVYSFFFVAKIVVHINTFMFYCIVLPITVMVPEVIVPKWSCVYFPCIITLLKAVGTPRSFYLLIFWVLFENTMSLHRTKATIIGLLEASRVNEWVVTEKLGDALKDKAGGNKVHKKHRFSIGDRYKMDKIYST
ncbi:glucomannan 4-beta-mannosyltransferase 9-like protein [Trifolium pratense]|uniref:Glucomannan 4-beta-mannosyltransferase 9-like protein n=1 Tax=Trifolium pratense TaxID=57577 RepID=A0A2K3PGX9_TRIPR|nr:glucomannan 4-beta-mannosyltransferase 9-like protein [Trifolium pratense]